MALGAKGIEMIKRAFVSHISEEASVAARLREALNRDFLGLLDVFVSSDGESIAAGEQWLASIEKALRDAAVMLILCSPTSIRRPWINFEAGAAWMRKIPLIPLCHAGLTPRDLMMPLSMRQGLSLDQAEDLRRLYSRIAGILSCREPARSFLDLVNEISGAPYHPENKVALNEVERDRAIRDRLRESLEHKRFRWRSLKETAVTAGISEEAAADLLRADPEVRFSKGKTGNIIVGLRSRVG
jgi:hypothetical protein